MNSACKQIEIAVHLNNKPTSVAEVMVLASIRPIEVLASCFYWERDGAVVRLVTEDPQRTGGALARASFLCQTDSVILLGPHNQPGVAVQTAARLALADIGIMYSYVSCTERTGAFTVLKTTDDDRALRVLQVSVLVDDLVHAKAGSSRRAHVVHEPLGVRTA